MSKKKATTAEVTEEISPVVEATVTAQEEAAHTDGTMPDTELTAVEEATEPTASHVKPVGKALNVQIKLFPVSVFDLHPEKNRTIDEKKVLDYARSIKEDGVIKPIRAKYNASTGLYDVMDGSHRVKAVRSLEKDGFTGIMIKCEILPASYSETDHIIDIIRLNDSANITPLDEAIQITKLIGYGYTQTAIAKKIGRTPPHVSQILILASAPPEVQDAINGNLISSTMILTIIKDYKNDIDAGWKAILREHKALQAIKPGAKLTEKEVKKTDLVKRPAPIYNKYAKITDIYKVRETPKEVQTRTKKAIDLVERLRNAKGDEYEAIATALEKLFAV